MPIEDLAKQVAVTLERDGNVHAVFGPSIELQHHVIVPVAVVSGLAAGGAGSPTSGGMAANLNVRPVGFIHESGEHVIFTPIHVDERKRSVLTEAAQGVRRAVDLAFSLVALFLRGNAPRDPPPPNLQGDGVASPS